MSIVIDIETKMREALKAGKSEDKSIYSYLLSRLRAKEVEVRHELSDSEAVAVIQKELKTLNKDLEAISAYSKAADAAENIKRQIEIYSEYVPKMLSKDEILSILNTFEVAPKGVIMKNFMKDHKSEVDGRIVSQAIDEWLKDKQ